MRSDEQNQLEGKHGSNQLVSKSASDQSGGIGVVGNLRELDLDHADKVTCVDGKKTKTNRADGTSNHAESGKGAGQRQTTESNSLNDEDDGETLPS